MNHVLFVDAGRIALSADTATLQKALRIGVSDHMPEQYIYREELGQKWAYVESNPDHTAGHINLELLYKALSTNKQKVVDAVQQSAGVQR